MLKYKITVFILCSLSRASMYTRNSDWVCETVNIQYEQADECLDAVRMPRHFQT